MSTILKNTTGLPPWVVLHVPHDSTVIPPEVRGQFCLSDEELAKEICRMSDHHTHALFATNAGEAAVVRAPVSRLVVDVERFADDADEPMAKVGMGAIYQVTSSLQLLRRPSTNAVRTALMQQWYYPHHERLESAVTAALIQHGRCLVIDCHSFPSVPLPYEIGENAQCRPDIFIGTDDFHTSDKLAEAFVCAFREVGWTVEVNKPFAGRWFRPAGIRVTRASQRLWLR